MRLQTIRDCSLQELGPIQVVFTTTKVGRYVEVFESNFVQVPRISLQD